MKLKEKAEKESTGRETTIEMRNKKVPAVKLKKKRVIKEVPPGKLNCEIQNDDAGRRCKYRMRGLKGGAYEKNKQIRADGEFQNKKNKAGTGK